ncbi:hypothetical protein O6H91_04G048000 [Diphasiastrum complanatum]|uniref:Uncharacterized protein n=1 Tax=Diphasiastrum complanatum TaxID=34168 RepID=A0ACC2DWS1_DIPCM|nr:hypothetical protein O6H91_Y316400 [Diphasiastrum complanatum]KAJ7558610.1 hypothetical protein O6H91_04G048000 [Diphasiastrum complanatum]
MQGAPSLIRAGYKQALAKLHPSPTHKPFLYALQQHKWVCQQPSIQPNKERPTSEMSSQLVIYEGHMSDVLRRVKVLSFTTCSLTAAGSPIITFFMYPGVSVFVKAAIASSMIILSASTTLGLHWFAGPYVHRLTWEPGSEQFDVKMLSWMGTYFNRTISIADVEAPDTQRPLVTFAAKGRFYFVDRDNFPDKKLLQKLIPGSRR